MEKQPEIIFKFPVDFDTGKEIPISLGRLYLCNGSTIRLYFTPEGLKAYINKNGNDIMISENFLDQIEFAGLKK